MLEIVFSKYDFTTRQICLLIIHPLLPNLVKILNKKKIFVGGKSKENIEAIVPVNILKSVCT